MRRQGLATITKKPQQHQDGVAACHQSQLQLQQLDGQSQCLEQQLLQHLHRVCQCNCCQPRQHARPNQMCALQLGRALTGPAQQVARVQQLRVQMRSDRRWRS
jgi:hypothetical protein